MPIKYASQHICENCHKKFEWIEFEGIRNKATDSHYVAEVIPSTTKAYHIEQNSDGDYDVRVNCPYCDYDNHFTISKSDYNNYSK